MKPADLTALLDDARPAVQNRTLYQLAKLGSGRARRARSDVEDAGLRGGAAQRRLGAHAHPDRAGARRPFDPP